MIDISKKSFLVDTNILIYTLDKKSPYLKIVGRFFEWCENEKTRLVVAHQNILELIRTLISDYGVSYEIAEEKARALVDGEHIHLISPLPTTLNKFFALTKIKGAKRGNVFDYYLAATAIDNGIDVIVTKNKEDFSKIKELEVLSLDEMLN